MDYMKKPIYHFKPKKGWINDPNGLVYFNGYYHIFYQHCPNFETTKCEPVYWGHTRTKDFLNWEHLPLALCPDKPFDCDGCWSGTAIVKDDTLYLYYASIVKTPDGKPGQAISVAYSKDGVNFEKYEKNPIITLDHSDGSPNFRDPAIAKINDKFYCVIASGHPENIKGRLLVYESENMFDWDYKGIMYEWDKCKYAECPSFIKTGNKYLLSASAVTIEDKRFFSIMLGDFENNKFTPEISDEIDRGPDQYAGQIFIDDKQRAILISWIPGWHYEGVFQKDIGCLSLPREIIVKDGRIYAYPVEEVQHLLKDSDPAVKITDDGLEIQRSGKEKIVYQGAVEDVKILRDEYVLEVFINKGQANYSVIL